MNREDNHTFLSIIIPVYNGLTHDLPICLESIWLQPLDPSQYEVICVDDCSTDDTRRWLDEEAAKHSFWGKMPVNDSVCCTKMGDGCCGDGRKNDDRYRKKNQRLQSVSWIVGFVFY